MQKSIYYKIADKFSKTPGPRYIKEGIFSAELLLDEGFRELFHEVVKNNDKIIVDLDDTAGYATSFLEGTFGQLARETSADTVSNHFEFVSNNRPWYIDEIKEYINDVRMDNN